MQSCEGFVDPNYCAKTGKLLSGLPRGKSLYFHVHLGGVLLLLRQHKRHHPPATRGPQNIPEVFEGPYQPVTSETLAQEAELRRQEQRKKLIARGISCRAAEAVADATAAAVAAQGLGSSWAEELAAAYPRLGPSSALVASALAGAPLELHMHLKTLFCATLKAALLSDIAVLELEHAAHPERKQSTAEADMRWLLSKTESVFKEIFYDPAFLAMASACDFEKPARELLRALQQLRAARNCTSSGATESLLPLLLTEKGRCALERFIAAVDEDILSSLCSSWEGSGVLQLHASQEQGKEDTSAPRTRQLSARHTGKDAGTSMALASYADER